MGAFRRQAAGLVVLLGILFFPTNSSNADASRKFGDLGYQIIDFTGGADIAIKVTLQSDGKIVATGQASGTGLIGTDFGVVRLLPDGTLDPDFGDGGKSTTDIADSLDYPRDVITFEEDGEHKILVLGHSRIAGDFDFALVKLREDGTLDDSFGEDGIVTTDVFFGSQDSAQSVLRLKDGRILISGSTVEGPNRELILLRYLPDGNLDPTFGSGGSFKFHLGWTSFSLSSLVVLSDGKILVSGTHAKSGKNRVMLVRIKKDGGLDLGLNKTGWLSLKAGKHYAIGKQVFVTAEGKMVLGMSWIDSTYYFGAIGLNADGTLDETFGTDGFIKTKIKTSLMGLQIQKDGKLVFAGTISGSESIDFVLARYHNDGTPDLSFGTAGQTISDFGGTTDQVNSIALQPDGKVVATGYTRGKTFNYNFIIARYRTDGTLDTRAAPRLPR